jgi:RNA polymerase sigma-70 factor, ECF subfamily
VGELERGFSILADGNNGRQNEAAKPVIKDDPGGTNDVAGLRPLLFSIAYRMLASVSDAEDLVQEAFLRYERARGDGADIHSPKAYLTTVVTRLAIDEMRSARARRETYPGEWLPEPLLTDESESEPDVIAERADTLSMAFLLLLERLNPVERAVFLLHDIFGYEFTDVAEIVGKSEANCRQIAVRARRYIEEGKPRFEPTRDKRDELTVRFFSAVTNGDVDNLREMLAQDVVVYGDGGGKAVQWWAPIVGAERVARLLANVGNQVRDRNGRFEIHELNGQAGAFVLAPDGKLISVFVLDIGGGTVQSVRSVINPDKLAHLGEVADVRALLQEKSRD